MARTLKASITQWNLLILAAALTLFALLLYAWLSRTMYGHHDDDLAEDARRVVELLAASHAPVETLAGIEESRIGLPLLMVRNQQGEMIFRSSRLAATEPDIGQHSVLTHAAMQGAKTAQFFTVTLGAGVARFICVPLAKPEGTYLQVGRSLGDVALLLRIVVIASAVLVPLVLVLTGFGAFASAKRALRPIDEIAASLESIQATDLSRRIDARAPDDEVRRITSAINQLLDRLNTSFTALKEFTADVSHQLQTPLTVMRGSMDVATAGTAADHRRVLEEASAEVNALSATLDDLRDYALADAESVTRGMAPIDVSAVFEEAADVVRALAEAHDLSCTVSIRSDLRVWGNAVRLRQVLLNLGENAVEFTAAGGRVQIEVIEESAAVVLRVRDTGTGIVAENLPRVFDRHFHARESQNRPGSGLGLAIAKRVVEAHNGRISIVSSIGMGTTATVILPIADDQSKGVDL